MKYFLGLLIAAALTFATMSLAQVQDLNFDLVKLTNVDIDEFYISRTTSDSWEENLLEGAYLLGGNEIEVTIADGETTC